MSTSVPSITLLPLAPGPLHDDRLSLELASFAPHPVHRNPAYRFRMVDMESRSEVGSINLRLGWDENLLLYAGHIGYEVHEGFRGRRYAARSVSLLRPLALRHGFPHLWITCDPANAASRRSCELAGAEYIETIDLPPNTEYYARGLRQKCRYRLPLR